MTRRPTRRSLALALLGASALAGCAQESPPNQMGGALDQGSDAARRALEPQEQPGPGEDRVVVP